MRYVRLWGLGALVLLLAAAAGPVRADERGDAILREALTKLEGAKSLTAEITVSVGTTQTSTQKGSLSLLKPNLLRAELEGTRTTQYVADGKDVYTFSGGTSYYKRAQAAGAPAAGPWGLEVAGFFIGAKALEGMTTTVTGTEKVSGVECDLVELKSTASPVPTIYAVGKADHVIYRSSQSRSLRLAANANPITYTRSTSLSNVKMGVALDAGSFAFVPPANTKLYEPPDYNAMLVAVGKAAPEFTLPKPGGGELSLAQARAGKKAVIVYFWFYG